MSDHGRISDLLKKAETDIETFRAEATAALQDFTPEDREYVSGTQCESADIDKVLNEWRVRLRPERQRLLQKRSDGNFRATLRRNIGFSDEQAREEIEFMIDERLELLLDETVDKLYPLEEGDPPHSLASQRAYALHFLSQSDEYIADFRDRYNDYRHYTNVAHAHSITVCDPHAGWLERQRCALQIRRERQQTREEEEARLLTVESEMQEIASVQNGLLGEIVQKGWDTTKLARLREKYSTRLEKLSKQATPLKKLKIFDETVQTFRDNEVEKAVGGLRQPSLESVRQKSEEIDTLLLKFFDLNEKAKDNLLADLKHYKKLQQEKEMVELIRQNRTAFQKRQEALKSP